MAASSRHWLNPASCTNHIAETDCVAGLRGLELANVPALALRGPRPDWAKFSEGMRPGPPDLKELANEDLFWGAEALAPNCPPESIVELQFGAQ
jgi:hypothetical protein